VIPAFLNPGAGTAEAAEQLIGSDTRFRLRKVEPAELPGAIEKEVRAGARRILVAGGDGTIATATRALLGGPVELAILPGGTLNHFARSLGIETLEQAIEVAAGTETRSIDVGLVNGHTFLNTSSVGSYVNLVRRRERWRHRLRYHLAGAAAAGSLLLRLPSFSVQLEVQGERRALNTHLVFFGVGERDLRLGSFGARVPDAPSDLHAIVVKGRGRARLLAVALATARHGIWKAARTAQVDSFMVPECVVHLPRKRMSVSLDGEIVQLESPLNYTIARGALTVVAPRNEGRDG
jgi:diacylglycerol kinase family enzyme